MAREIDETTGQPPATDETATGGGALPARPRAGVRAARPLRVTLTVDVAPEFKAPLGERRLRQLVRTVLANEGLSGRVAVAIHVVDDETIRRLNRDYRGQDRPTDVLSFPLEQAQEYGHSPAREFAYLVTHGLLHLLGYDHETPEEQRAMREREEAALCAVGLSR